MNFMLISYTTSADVLCADLGRCMAQEAVWPTGKASETNIIVVLAGNNKGTAVLWVSYLQSVWDGNLTMKPKFMGYA